MNQLLKTYEDKILKLQATPNSSALLAEISKIKITLELLGIKVPSIAGIPENGSSTDLMNHVSTIPQSHIPNPEPLITERDKLQRMLTRHDSAELRAKVAELDEKIDAMSIPEAKQTDEIKEMYSNILQEKFTWNKTQGRIIFESGAVYTEEEIHALGPEAVIMVHKIKSKFKAKFQKIITNFKPIHEGAI